jgi:glycosyltransferase involved in cell wall biosynthesis
MVLQERDNATLVADTKRPLRVAIVCPVFANYDAIGASARDTYLALRQESAFDVTALTFRNDYEDVSARVVSGLADMLLDPAFQTADIIVYHFGIYCELFDALIAAKGRALQFVRFHNVTPSYLVVPKLRHLIERSFVQLHNLKYADEVWADSRVNAETLEALGIDRSRVQVIPLSVDRPTTRTLCGKAPTRLNLLFVGRFVPSKGVLDLLEAVDLVRRRCTVPFRLRLAGNMEWSDQTYLTSVKDAITARKLDTHVEILGTVNSEVMQNLYHEAHILVVPSYHEGFCKPVVEALRAGCIPIGYASYNLPAISNGLGRMVATGDSDALHAALAEVMEAIGPALNAPDEPLLPLDKGQTSVRGFDRAAEEYVQTFTFNRLTSAMLERIHAVRTGS